MELFKDSRHAAAILKVSGEYDEKADRFLTLVRNQKLAEANQFNSQVLRPCYDEYQLILDSAADFVQQQGMHLRDRYAEDSRVFGGFLLAFAGWPLIAAGALIVMMGLLVAGLLVTVFFPRFFARKAA
jgi:hypothetical protein